MRLANAGAFRPRRDAAPSVFERAGADGFGFDHEADRGAVFAGNGVQHVRRHHQQFAAGLDTVGRGQPQAAAERHIDVKRARAALARPAEQASVEHALRRNQH